MKLVAFNPENCVAVKRGTPGVNINYKTGLITLNKYACEMIGVADGTGVEFYNDEEDSINWYLAVTASGFIMRAKSSGSCMINNSTLARKIIDSYDESGNMSFLIAGKPTKLGKLTLFGLLPRKKV